MSFKHGDIFCRDNVRPIYKSIEIQHIGYPYHQVFNYSKLRWECRTDFTKPYNYIEVKYTNEIIGYCKLKYPKQIYRFRMDPSPTGCCHHGCYGNYRYAVLVLRDYKYHHDVQIFDNDDDIEFIDTRAKIRYKTSGMWGFDGKWNGNPRSWKRTKVNKQWERKIKRQTKKQVCWHDQDMEGEIPPYLYSNQQL